MLASGGQAEDVRPCEAATVPVLRRAELGADADDVGQLHHLPVRVRADRRSRGWAGWCRRNRVPSTACRRVFHRSPQKSSSHYIATVWKSTDSQQARGDRQHMILRRPARNWRVKLSAERRRGRCGYRPPQRARQFLDRDSVRAFERCEISGTAWEPSWEPSGEESQGVWGSPGGHLPSSAALPGRCRHLQAAVRPNSHRGGRRQIHRERRVEGDGGQLADAVLA